jgi:ubiquinone/menaquinone biosynthesis C-methylase UbiE
MHKAQDSKRLDSKERREILPIDAFLRTIDHSRRDITVADLGCGTGYLSLPLAHFLAGQGRVFAVDINPRMLEIVKERVGSLTNIHLVHSRENEIPLEDRIIDVSFLVAVLHELEKPDDFLREVRRISKQSHRVIVADWNQVPGEFGPPMHERIPEPEALGIFESNGYRLEMYFAPSPYVFGFVLTS